MKKFEIGDKVYYLQNKQDEGEIADYNPENREFLIKSKDGSFIWSSGYSWSKDWYCYHNWLPYIGFRHRDYYCNKCGEIKPWENKS